MRLRIDYFDQNDKFEKLLPRSGTVERTIPANDSALTWYLLKLDEPLDCEGSAINRLYIASRWRYQSVGDFEPTSVFVLLVPAGTIVGQSFSTSQYAQVVWGMANTLTNS